MSPKKAWGTTADSIDVVELRHELHIAGLKYQAYLVDGLYASRVSWCCSCHQSAMLCSGLTEAKHFYKGRVVT